MFRFRIDLVQRKAHDADQKEFQQTMTTNEFSCHGLTSLGQFHTVIGGIAHVATLTQPLEELGDACIAQLSRRLEWLQAFPHDRGSNGLATLAQFVAEFQAVYGTYRQSMQFR